MDRLHKKGMIENPAVSEVGGIHHRGLHRLQELFEQMFKKNSVAGSEREPPGLSASESRGSAETCPGFRFTQSGLRSLTALIPRRAGAARGR